ncbi:AMC1 [Symbiodinium natans]|uniref:AMC1 protein n=1 Tax=Symbiodinium natans TaxID=878477 RepID=A0A812SDH1_9DINO|nr:AMC1 [Symbiodinium natans]
MPLVVEVLCGRHFFVEQPCCFTKFTYGGQEYSTDADNGATSPQWQKTKFQLPYAGKAVEINFLVMNRKGRGESMQIASVMVQWASFLPGLRKVEDYIVKAEVDGVKDTAAIRVAATLIPEGITGDPQRDKPNRKALLIGISYLNTAMSLPYCQEDAEKMRWLLCEKWGGFSASPDNLKVLMDGKDNPEERPTKANIRAAISWLVHEAVAGDSLLFFYSGHGTQTPNMTDREKDGFDEALVPCDVDENGILLDDEIHELLVQPLPAGVRLTCFLDCCHSGTGLDLAYRWSPYVEANGKGEWQLDGGGYYSEADVICISGCADDQTAVGNSALARGSEQFPLGMPTGMCSAAFWVAVEVHETQCKMNWTEMLNIMKDVLKDFNMRQQPQLSSSQKFDLTRQFDFHDCIPNSNEHKGPVSCEGDVRSRGEAMFSALNFLKDERFMSSGPMQMMLQAGAIRLPP